MNIRMKKLLPVLILLFLHIAFNPVPAGAANAEDFHGRPVLSNQVLVRYSDDAERVILAGEIEQENKSSSIWDWFRKFFTTVFTLGFNTFEKQVTEEYDAVEEQIGILRHIPLEENPTLRAPSRSLQLGSFNPYGDDPRRNLYMVVFENGTVEEAVAALDQLSFVELVQPNFLYAASKTPNDPRFASQWSHKRVHSEQAWDVTTGANETIIAVIDTGINYNHTDLTDNMWTSNEYPNHGYDFFGYDCDPHADDTCTQKGREDNDPMDESGHGTMVAGVAGAVCNNNKDVCGAMWRSGIMALRAGGMREVTINGEKKQGEYLSSDAIFLSMEFAGAHGADVVNMSFGVEGNCTEGMPTDPLYNSTVSRLVGKWNAVPIIAAGNAGKNAGCEYFAALGDVLAVSATTVNGEKDTAASYSNFAPFAWKDFKVIAAPGGSDEFPIITTYITGDVIASKGTSFSAPLVAGIAGLIRTLNPDMAAPAVIKLLIDTADDIVDVNSNPPDGMTYGKLVNAAKALGSATVLPTPTTSQPAGSCQSDFGGVCKTNTECAQFALTPIGIYGCDPDGKTNKVCCVESSPCSQQRGFCINPASKDKFSDCAIVDGVACSPAGNVCCVPKNLVTPKPVSCVNEKKGQCLDLQQCFSDPNKTGTEVYDCNAQTNEVCCIPNNLLTPTTPPGGQPTTPPQPTQPPAPTQSSQPQENQTYQVDWTYNGAGKCWSAWAGNQCGYASHEGGEGATGRDLDGAGTADIECSQGTGAGQSTTVRNISANKTFDIRCEYYVCNQCVESSPGSKTARCDEGIHQSAAKNLLGTIQLKPGQSATCTKDGIR